MKARFLAQRLGQIMSMGKVEGGQANDADVATNASESDIKYCCKCLTSFVFFSSEELQK